MSPESFEDRGHSYTFADAPNVMPQDREWSIFEDGVPFGTMTAYFWDGTDADDWALSEADRLVDGTFPNWREAIMAVLDARDDGTWDF